MARLRWARSLASAGTGLTMSASKHSFAAAQEMNRSSWRYRRSPKGASRRPLGNRQDFVTWPPSKVEGVLESSTLLS